MGWWSEDILGGDTPLDILSDIESQIFGEKAGSTKATSLYPLALGSKAKNKRVKNWLTKHELVNEEKSYYGCYFLPVVAAVYMTFGVPMSPEFRKAAIEATLSEDVSNWNNPDLRLKALEHHVKLIREYDGTPVSIEHKGLFQCFADHNGDGLINVK